MTEDFLLIPIDKSNCLTPSTHFIKYISTGWARLGEEPKNFSGSWMQEDAWGNYVGWVAEPTFPENILEDGELSAEFLRTGPQDGYWVWRIDYKKHETN